MTRISVALAALLVSAPVALAQTTPTTPTAPSDRPAAGAPAKSGDMKFYSRQATDMRATNLIGANVTNMANETVGEINDLVLDKDGKVAAVVVGVGGFLGIGEREVALDYKSLNIKYDPNAMTNAGATTIQVNATKDSLKSAPAWTWNNNTGTGTRRPVAK
jgi:sporulation protein YlmC with PRC-barrel domain